MSFDPWHVTILLQSENVFELRGITKLVINLTKITTSAMTRKFCPNMAVIESFPIVNFLTSHSIISVRCSLDLKSPILYAKLSWMLNFFHKAKEVSSILKYWVI